ncbi:MAG: HPP family protein [Gammaproteobacteria bacterium]|nr:HPP family protein [Gammaproteobacteria bacterium]
MSKLLTKLKNILAIDSSVSTAEKLASSIGGFIGIFLISAISFYFTGAEGATLIIPSMGASAVLVFAVPHGKLSQPWALFGGQLSSAFVGVSCYLLVPDLFLAAGLAVGLAIGSMHILRCIHPPGGATALVAVVGSAEIHQLGYEYLLTPVLLNTLIIFITAFLYNSLFPWRRYPANMMRFIDSPTTRQKRSRHIEKKHIEHALSDIDLVVDVNVNDLQRLFALTLEHAEAPMIATDKIILGHYYTNNKHGAEWSVRQIIDEAKSDDPNKDMVIYRIEEGQGLQRADSCTRTEFARWAIRELFPRHQDNP